VDLLLGKERNGWEIGEWEGKGSRGKEMRRKGRGGDLHFLQIDVCLGPVYVSVL